MGTLPMSFVPSTTQLHRLRGAGFSCIVSLTSDSCSLIRLSYKRLLSGTEELSSPEIVHSWEANPNNNERRKK